MNSQYVKIILIALLSVFAVTLFYFYVSSDDKINVTGNTEKSNSVRSKDMILADIDSILYSFGIRKEWIREAAGREKDQKKTNDELTFNKEVRIPQDLPAVDLNYEITNYFRTYNDEIKVTEDPRTKNITMNILSLTDTVKKQVGIIKIIYSDTLKRNAADIAMVLDSLDHYSLKEAGEILSSTQAFSVILPMRNDKADYQSKIIELNRDYLLKLSVGNEDDIEADFKEGMKEGIRSSKIKSLSLNFQNASGVILINKTADPEFFSAVKNDFIKNNIKIYDESVFDKFRTGENAVVSLFEDIITEAKVGKKALFYDINFGPEEFASYDRQLYNMKKLGYRFYSFRDLMSRSKQ